MVEKQERNIIYRSGKMKNILVTGGSRGIGACLVKELAKKGNNIVLNYYKSEKEARNIQEELKKVGISIEVFKADVSKHDEVKKLKDFFFSKYKSIDVLINNAGISQIKLFTEITDQEWEKMISTNLNSVFYTTKEFVTNMINNKKGCIINISSIWGVIGASCEVHYSTAKAGIIGMTKALARELGLSNIRVNAIAPGIIDTQMNQEINKEEVENLKNEIPLGKIGSTMDVLKCAEWLIEDQYTTGQVISINGGWSM